MQIITPAQCRAARALLNWSQPELAERCDIHVQTISNFEKESSTPSRTTLGKIANVFKTAKINFLADDGVKREHSFIQEFHGPDGFRLFMDDVYDVARNTGGEFCLLNAKPDNWIRYLGKEWMDFHADRMAALGDRLNFKITAKEGDRNFISRKFAEYRWVPARIWNQYSYYAYGDKIAFLNFENDDVNILVLTHPHFAKTHKFLFKLVWEKHTLIPDDDLLRGA